MGLTKNEFFHSTPKVLNAYDEAHKIKLKETDRLIWMFCGNYVMNAVSVAVEACLAGKKARGKYIDTPIFEKIDEQENVLDEKTLQKQRELFVAKLEVMKANFELNKKKNKDK